MKKIALGVSLLIVSFNVMAGWTKFFLATDGAVYVDLDSVHKSNNNVKLWMLIDLEKQRHHNHLYFLSVKSQIVIDCYQEFYRYNIQEFYSGHMEKGVLMDTFKALKIEWAPILPNTDIELMHNKFCTKKS